MTGNEQMKTDVAVKWPIESQEWYVKALEHLTPLRYQMYKLIEVVKDHNRFAKTMDAEDLSLQIPTDQIEPAIQAMNKANEFFCGHKFHPVLKTTSE